MGRGGEAKALMEGLNRSSEGYGSGSKGPLSPPPEDPERSSLENDMTVQRRPRVWVTLLVAILVGLVAGSLYGFGRYSRDLRDTLGIRQMTVQRFGILLDTGNYIGHPLTGWMYDRFGPRKSCLAAALIVFCSYGSIHLGLASAPIWMMDLGFFGVGFGSGLGYIAGLGSTTSAFASTPHLGRSVGLVAAGYGFSSTVVGITYHHTGLKYFFLLWAFMVAVMNVIGAFVFSPKEQQQQQEEEEVEETPDSPLMEQETSLELQSTDLEASLLRQETSDSDVLEDLEPSSRGANGEWTSWKRLDFWLLFGSFACITGCGLMIINNISTMVQSIGGEDSLAGYLVFGLSICNVVGRILMGSLADHPKLHKLDLYRYASLLMATALVTSAVGGTSAVCLAITVAFAAIAYGGSWVLIIGILADFYGKEDFGKDYGLIAMGPAVSGMVFNSLSAKVYESHADESTVVSGDRLYSERIYCELGSYPIVLLSRNETNGEFTLVDRLHPLTTNLTLGGFRRLETSDVISQSVRSSWIPGVVAGGDDGSKHDLERYLYEDFLGTEGNDTSLFYARECSCFGPKYTTVYCPLAVETCLRPKRRNDLQLSGCMNRTPGGGFGGGAFVIMMGLYLSAFFYLMCSRMGFNFLGFLVGRCTERWNNSIVDRILEQDPQDAAEMVRQIYMERPEELEHMAREEIRQAARRPTSLILHTKIFHQDQECQDCSTGHESNDADADADDEEERQCAICYIPLEEGDKIGRLPCSHNFHADCLKAWVARRNVCPLCQTRNIAEAAYDEVDRPTNENTGEDDSQSAGSVGSQEHGMEPSNS